MSEPPEGNLTGSAWVGRSLPNPHDRDLVQGQGCYVGDLWLPGLLEAHFVRSPHAHASVRAVTVGPALAVPGVLAGYTGADLAGLPPAPPAARSAQPPGMRRPLLATDRVRFAGEALAVLLAVDRYRAEDGAAEVLLDLDPLPVAATVAAAVAPDGPRLFPGLDNVSSTRLVGADRADELDRAFAAAAVRSSTVAVSQRLSPMSIEPRAVLAAPADGGGLRLWCSHQAPHRLRLALARTLGLEPERVRVIAPDVGGAFGAKSQVYPEYLVVAELARRHGRPVRWLEDRREALTAATHGRAQTLTVRLAATADGRILALDADLDSDVGAYPDYGDFVPEMTSWVLCGPYRIPLVRIRQRSVLTNTAPVASYRGAGRPEAAYALERAIDDLARLLSLDPVELRRRNLIPEEAFPYRSATGACYDSGRYHSALELATRLADYPGLRAEQARRRAARSGPLLGIGVSSWVERSGGESGSREYARVAVQPDGTVLGQVGTSPQGQGHLIGFAQVLADAIGLHPGRIRIELGDTALVPEGTGAFGSRSMQVGGTALYLAGQAVRAAALEQAARLLGCPPERVRQQGDRFHCVGFDGDGVGRDGSGRDGFDRDRATGAGSGDGISLAELAGSAAAAGRPLRAERVAAPPQAFPFGCYLCAVEVDPATGAVRVRRLVAVDDCGVPVNPAVVRGQTVGSIVQGLGQALYEQVRYDPDGQPLASTLLDYTVPTSAELPPIELGPHVTPNPNVPLGTKGAGESGCIGAPPAVLNAVRDALAGLDVDSSRLQLPLTADRVWACLHGAAPEPSEPPEPSERSSRPESPDRDVSVPGTLRSATPHKDAART